MAQLFDIKKVTVGPKNLEAIVELAANAPLMTSEDLEGTTRVWQVMPELRDHVCLGDESGTFGDVMGDTELAHLLEHVTVELLARTDVAGDIACGQTSEVGERTYKIVLKCIDDVLVVGALSSAASRLRRSLWRMPRRSSASPWIWAICCWAPIVVDPMQRAALLPIPLSAS
mgnify:CR=1 FL=1